MRNALVTAWGTARPRWPEFSVLCLLERIHPQGHAHPRAVREEGSQGRLLKEAEYEDLVPGEKNGEESAPGDHKLPVQPWAWTEGLRFSQSPPSPPFP